MLVWPFLDPGGVVSWNIIFSSFLIEEVTCYFEVGSTFVHLLLFSVGLCLLSCLDEDFVYILGEERCA